MTSIWDNPELRTSGEFVKFEAVGDTIAGTITAIRAHQFTNVNNGVTTTSTAPQIMLVTDDGEEKTVTAGQVRLKAALVEKRPDAGDHITITLTDIEKKGTKTLKHFDVQVRAAAAESAPATAAPAVPPAAATPDAAAIAAAVGNLTPEQKAALGFA